MLWTGLSRLTNEATEKKIQLDDIHYLKNYIEKAREESQALGQLNETLPEVVQKLERLANALKSSQNYLKVVGAKVN